MPDSAITRRTLGLRLRIAAASSSVIRGLLACFWKSSSDNEIPNCCTEKVSTPMPDWIASFTLALSPCTSDTTAMIDVTATMLPRTVRNERSLLAQMADRAIDAASRN